MISKDRLIDLFYMYGADIAQKMEQIASLEGYGTLEKSREVADMELSFYIPGYTNKFTVKMEDGTYFLICNNDLLLRLDQQINNILDTIDGINEHENKGFSVNYNIVIEHIQEQNLALINEAINYIKEWK